MLKLFYMFLKHWVESSLLSGSLKHAPSSKLNLQMNTCIYLFCVQTFSMHLQMAGSCSWTTAFIALVRLFTSVSDHDHMMSGLDNICWGRRPEHLELGETDVDQGVGHPLWGAQVHPQQHWHCSHIHFPGWETKLAPVGSQQCMRATGTETLPSSSLTWRWPSYI